MEDAASARERSRAGSSRASSRSIRSRTSSPGAAGGANNHPRSVSSRRSSRPRTATSRRSSRPRSVSSRRSSRPGSRATVRTASTRRSEDDDSGPDTELLQAALRDSSSVIELLEEGANALAKTKKGFNILHRLLNENLLTAARLRKLLEVIGEERTAELINSAASDGNTAFHVASSSGRKGQAEILDVLMQHGAAISTPGNDGRYPLNIAALNGFDENVEFLLKHKDNLDIDAKEAAGMSPLDNACWKGHFDIAKMLVEAGANIHSRDNDSWTPLRTAGQYGHDAIVDLLLDHGADISATDWEGLTALHAAARDNELSTVELLLKRGAYVNCRDLYGCTPLDLSCWKGNDDMVTFLLDNGASINVCDLEGLTPLMTACEYKNESLVDLLLARGADMNRVDIRGRNALDKANYADHGRIMHRLILEGMFSDNGDTEGWTPFMTCCRYGYRDAVQRLLQRGADINKVDDTGWTGLLKASYGGQLEVVETLIRYSPVKVNVDAQEEDGETALQSACQGGSYEIAELLLKEGKANPDLADHKGRTPLHKACQMGYEPLVRLLLENGASLHLCDKEMYTAFHITSMCDLKDQEIPTPDEKIGDICTGVDMPWRRDRLPKEAGKYTEILEYLLGRGANSSDKVIGNMTALHLAAKIDDPGRMKRLLQHMPITSRSLQNDDGETALAISLSLKHKSTSTILLSELEVVDFGTKDMEREALVWAAWNEDCHHIARLIFLKSAKQSDISLEQRGWSAMHWAAHRGLTDVLWGLLNSSEWGPETDRVRESAQEVALKARDAASRGKKPTVPKKAGEPRPSERRRVGSMKEPASKGQRQREGKSAPEKPAEETEKRLEVTVEEVIPASPGAGNLSPVDNVQRDDWPRPAQQNSPPQDEFGREYGSKKHAATKPEDGGDKSSKPDVYDLIVDMLRDPPIKRTSGPHVPFERPIIGPNTRAAIKGYEAAMVDFYAAGGTSGFLARFRSVAETIYDTGSIDIMRKARDNMRIISSGVVDNLNEQQKAYTENDLRFQWVHLPANNMKWMNDLILRRCIDTEKPERAFSEMADFLRKSWVQTPDRVSKTRYMKPRCVKEEREEYEDGSMALYIPYLTFSQEHKEGTKYEPREDYHRLMNTYADEPMHGSRTLDEFYYHFSSEPRFMEDMRQRNLDQVVTKSIDGPPEGKDTWTAVRVDQVWLWVIDESTIITSSTHRIDGDEDPFFKGMIDLLAKSGEKKAGQAQPADAYEMSQLIVDFCIGFFDRQPRRRGHDPAKQRWHGSVRQIFSDEINKTAIEEADLFRNFTQEKLEKNSRKSKAKGRKEAMGTAASLFRNIKDIRDELNILKALAETQEAVQLALLRDREPDFQASAKSVIRDIKEMDEIARRIQNSVNTTLTLEQNDIAISQAQEGVKQGRTLMVFTVVTILFLPMSFLTSLLALDVASFMDTPSWAFVVIFCVSVGLCLPLASYAFYSESLMKFIHDRFPSSPQEALTPPPSTEHPARSTAPSIRTDREIIRDAADARNEHLSAYDNGLHKDDLAINIDELTHAQGHPRRSEFRWPLVRRQRGARTQDEEALETKDRW